MIFLIISVLMTLGFLYFWGVTFSKSLGNGGMKYFIISEVCLIGCFSSSFGIAVSIAFMFT